MQQDLFSKLTTRAGESYNRFPLAILSSFLAASLLLIYILGFSNQENAGASKDYFFSIILGFNIGIPLFILSQLVTENRPTQGKWKHIWHILAATIVGVVILVSGIFNYDNSFPYQAFFFRYMLSFLVVHILTACLPLFLRYDENAFQRFNEIMFSKFITSIFYTTTIIGGISICIGVFIGLFDTSVNEFVFPFTLTMAGYVFNTWHFVGGVPSEIQTVHIQAAPSIRLRNFISYIVIPFIVLYQLILLMYGANILMTWDWPKGMISYLVISIAIIGIPTFLLLERQKEEDESFRFKILKKGFYLSLMLVTILLFLAVNMRISAYGVTIPRYFLMAMGVWIFIASAMGLFVKRYVRYIPLSLWGMFILISFGPWGAFSVSERSQAARLRQLLEYKEIISGEKIINEVQWDKGQLPSLVSTDSVDKEVLMSKTDEEEIFSILQYLESNHGFGAINHWFAQDMESICEQTRRPDSENTLSHSEVYMRTLGIHYEKNEFLDDYEEYDEPALIYFQAKDKEKVQSYVAGYDHAALFNYDNPDYGDSVSIDSIHLLDLNIESPNDQLFYERGTSMKLNLLVGKDVITVDAGQLLQKLMTKYEMEENDHIPWQELEMSVQGKKYICTVRFSDIHFNEKEDVPARPSSFSGILLVRKR